MSCSATNTSVTQGAQGRSRPESAPLQWSRRKLPPRPLSRGLLWLLLRIPRVGRTEDQRVAFGERAAVQLEDPPSAGVGGRCIHSHARETKQTPGVGKGGSPCRGGDDAGFPGAGSQEETPLPCWEARATRPHGDPQPGSTRGIGCSCMFLFYDCRCRNKSNGRSAQRRLAYPIPAPTHYWSHPHPHLSAAPQAPLQPPTKCQSEINATQNCSP